MLIGTIICIFTSVILLILIVKYYFNKDAIAQRKLNKYLRKNLSKNEIGKFYERYIGYLYESQGYVVDYNGVNNTYADLGRDLIVNSESEVAVIQAKCWANQKFITEKHIFQLFGTTIHYKLTSDFKNYPVKAVFYTTAKYSKTAVEVANVLGVELKYLSLNRSYPIIKCSTSYNGSKTYHLPFDPSYDKLRIDLRKQECFVLSVKEAVEKGFVRAS